VEFGKQKSNSRLLEVDVTDGLLQNRGLTVLRVNTRFAFVHA
jgi:hypothetical protein